MPASHPDPDAPAPDRVTAPLDPSILRRVEEAAYLTAPNAERYRVIVHFFYQQYVEQRDWLTVEQVWHHVREHFDSGYTPTLDTIIVQHEARVMTRNLKNVTVTLAPDAARWARIEAARRGTSVSRLLGEMIEAEMGSRTAYDQAKERFFRQEAGLHRTDGCRLPTREELHDRQGLR